MYHSRTKKVASYGRRAQRVVAISDDRRFSLDDFSASSKERPDVVEQPNIARKNRDDEDVFTYPSKPKLVKSHLADRKSSKHVTTTSSPRKAMGKKLGTKGTPSRHPLGLYRSNVPESPAMPPKKLKSRAPKGTGTPLRLGNVSNINPYVDVEIIVVDDRGRRLSEERRITKANVQVNDANGGLAKAAKRSRRSTVVKSYAMSASEDEEDDDEEYVPMIKAAKCKRDTKEPVGSSSHTNSQLKPKPRKPQVPAQKSSSDDSDSEVPRKLPALKKATRMVVISDSESDSGAKTLAKTKKAMKPKAKHTSIIGSVNTEAKKLAAKLALEIADENLRRQPAKRDVVVLIPSAPPKSQNSNADGQMAKPKKSATTTATRDASSQKAANGGALSHERISVDSDSHLPARRVTPIKPSRSKVPFLQQRPVKSSPSRLIVISDDDDNSFSIDEELELALQVADLQLAKDSRPNPKSSAATSSKNGQVKQSCKQQSDSQTPSQRLHVPSFIRPLLSECGQLTPFGFETFIETFPADPIINFSDHTGFSETLNRSISFHSFQKVGEASYSEVFGIGNVVLKVVPLLDEEKDDFVTWSDEEESPPTSESKDVLREILVTRAMGDLCKGFIKLLKAHVVQGPYPQSLLDLWDQYDSIKGSESIRPDKFSQKQTYAIIILPNGGPDLETFSFIPSTLIGGIGWRQACSIFWQVVKSLARAEDLVHFEHRDLHWGQILIRNTMKPSRALTTSARGQLSMDDPSHGVQSTIIDLGLSRIDQGCGNSFWTPFTEEIFEGEGDYQYDIYRMMRKHNKDEWESFRPLTNVMWLHYLADKLIKHKQIKPLSNPSGRPSRKSMHTNGHTAIGDVDKLAYSCLIEVEKMLALSIASIARRAGVKVKKRSKSIRDSSIPQQLDDFSNEFKSASDILRLGKEKGWIL